jgi:drug/metabolite transporter (DMT)-like permease
MNRALSALWHSPAALLLGTGLFLGLTFPLGRMATDAGVHPAVWAFLISCGTSLAMALAVLPFRPSAARFDRGTLRYFAVAAAVSYALPNFLVFAAIPRMGSGYVAIFFTLSPLFTLAISALAGLKRPVNLEIAGLGVAFAGALLVAASRGEIGRTAGPGWVLLGLLIPLSLAFGNVYRTIDWPRGADPLWLAIGSHGAAALMLAALVVATTGLAGFASLGGVVGIAAIQVAASALMFALYFQLQRVGGPVTLSQIGAVAAAVGVFAGAAVFGERYAVIVWTGVAIIAAGLGLTVAAKWR